MLTWLQNLIDVVRNTVKTGYQRMMNREVGESNVRIVTSNQSRPEEEETRDNRLWSKDLEEHYYGDFSFATVQANTNMEDYSQVEVGPYATFVGVYDGHGGSQASHSIRNRLFNHLMASVRENQSMTEQGLMNAFTNTENDFLADVAATFEEIPLTATVGSCCLVGVFWEKKLFIANLGDSRVVKGCLYKSNKIRAEQLSKDHNASCKEVRRELRKNHPGDKDIVSNINGCWRVKGNIQVSRAIGDAYLKKPEFALGHSFNKYHLSEPITKPVLSAIPSMYSVNLKPKDKFFIFASDGLWDYVTNQAAVEIVHKSDHRAGIAKRLITTALMEAAKRYNKTYEEFKEQTSRREIHDDITVVVIFIDDQKANVPVRSVLGGVDAEKSSHFSFLENNKLKAM